VAGMPMISIAQTVPACASCKKKDEG
jgi:hypothetical protein